MPKSFTALLVSGLAALPVTLSAAPEDCAKIADTVDRLACYDDIFGVAASRPAQTLSKWRKEIRENPMTDERDVFLSLESEDTISGRFSASGHGRIYLRCMENTTAIQFAVGDHFLADIQGYGRVEYRLDDSPMRKRNFTESTDNSTLGLWNGSRAIPFIKEMLGHERMIVRITPFNESPRMMTFSIAGLDADIGDLRDTCGW